MADVSRLLLLPPPGQQGRNSPARIGAGRGDGDSGSDLSPRIEEAGDSTANARGKQFRFRVFDGGRSDQLAGNAEVPVRADANTRDSNAADNTAATSGRTAALGFQGKGSTSNAVPLGTPSSAFLAQLIAQEQLKPGLFDPPVKEADRAYRQAGGEPALTDDTSGTARFKMAV